MANTQYMLDGAKMKAIRKKRGKTQRDIAVALDTSSNYICRLENSDNEGKNCSVDLCTRLALFLETTMAELVTEYEGEDDAQPSETAPIGNIDDGAQNGSGVADGPEEVPNSFCGGCFDAASSLPVALFDWSEQAWI